MRVALLVAMLASSAVSAASPPPQQDPAIERLLALVSADRLRAADERLVAFGTRNTFSETAPAGRGVFAARDWIAEQFGAIAAGTGGRMTVASTNTPSTPTVNASRATWKSPA